MTIRSSPSWRNRTQIPSANGSKCRSEAPRRTACSSKLLTSSTGSACSGRMGLAPSIGAQKAALSRSSGWIAVSFVDMRQKRYLHPVEQTCAKVACVPECDQSQDTFPTITIHPHMLSSMARCTSIAWPLEKLAHPEHPSPLDQSHTMPRRQPRESALPTQASVFCPDGGCRRPAPTSAGVFCLYRGCRRSDTTPKLSALGQRAGRGASMRRETGKKGQKKGPWVNPGPKRCRRQFPAQNGDHLHLSYA